MAEAHTDVEKLSTRVKAECRANVPLANLCTFRIGGPADILAEPKNDAEALELVNALADLQIPWMVLGGGSNVLIGDGGIRGCVIKLAGTLNRVVISDDGKTVDVGAGANFAKLTKTCMALGWPRSNGWIGTPGTVGGALIMNAGSREGEVGECVNSVRVISDREVVELSREQCGFVYRNSTFPKQSLLLSVKLSCNNADSSQSEHIAELARLSLQRRHKTQPKEHSAGSIFKNPPGTFAGKLLEEAGLKGRHSGGALVSPTHANFIVNTGGATARDVVTLAEECQRVVLERTGIQLEWEVKRIGEFT